MLASLQRTKCVSVNLYRVPGQCPDNDLSDTAGWGTSTRLDVQRNSQ
jgi:hypothetical protein